MNTLYFGGSFNPIHNGHLICARAVANIQDYTQVILIPSARPPHKPETLSLAPAEDRLAMCQIVAAEDELFQVDDIEIRRSGLSYTIDTVRELKRRGAGEVHWLIGADMLNFLPRWHEADALVKEVHFVVMARPRFEFEWSTLPPSFQALRDHIVQAPRIEISATEIRNRIRAGRPIGDVVPTRVAQYINEHHLFK